jgi:hypothetical protein
VLDDFGPQNTLSLVESEVVMTLYSTINFPSKKAMRDAVKLRLRWLELQSVCSSGIDIASLLLHKEFPNGEPPAITLYQPNNMFGIVCCVEGIETVEGPHYPKPHKWAARCAIMNSEVVKVL